MTEIDDLRRELQELKTQVSTLSRTVGDQTDVIDNHVGIDWGASGMGQPHPTQLNFNREIHGPSKTSVDSTHDMEFPVDFDDTVQYLHQSKLTVRMFPVRSNVSTSASAGSSSPTTSSGGSSSPTSAGGGSHNHLVMQKAAFDVITTVGTPEDDVGGTLTAAEFMAHYHVVDLATPGYTMKLSGGGDHSFALAMTSAPGGDGHLYTYDSAASHTHGVTIAGHTHDVTISGHSHDLTYGIYEGAAPSAPAITIEINGVDRTSALGGPWNADFTVDITPYVRDPISGQPLRPTNEIVLGSDELIDTEMTVKSFVSCVTPFILGVQS